MAGRRGAERFRCAYAARAVRVRRVGSAEIAITKATASTLLGSTAPVSKDDAFARGSRRALLWRAVQLVRAAGSRALGPPSINWRWFVSRTHSPGERPTTGHCRATVARSTWWWHVRR